MAILTSSRLPGDPHELLANDRRTDTERLRDVAVRHGRLIQVVVDEGDGLRLFDLWESEAGMLRAREQTRSVADTPVPIQWEWRQWDVLHHHVYIKKETRCDETPWS
jgi:hypothetical protein